MKEGFHRIMDRKNKIFAAIAAIMLFFVITAANIQKTSNQSQQMQQTQTEAPAAQSSENSASSGTSSASGDQAKYNDGTYEGQGSGKNPGIKVSVTVKDGKISAITILSSNDDRRFFNEAESVIPKSIIDAQSTDVDTVSGATLSSNGIIMAVEDALLKATQ